MHPGVYNESITLDKQVTLMGAGQYEGGRERGEGVRCVWLRQTRNERHVCS